MSDVTRKDREAAANAVGQESPHASCNACFTPLEQWFESGCRKDGCGYEVGEYEYSVGLEGIAAAIAQARAEGRAERDGG